MESYLSSTMSRDIVEQGTNAIGQLALNSQLQTYQILVDDDQMLILSLSYFITTVRNEEVIGLKVNT